MKIAPRLLESDAVTLQHNPPAALSKAVCMMDTTLFAGRLAAVANASGSTSTRPPESSL